MNNLIDLGRPFLVVPDGKDYLIESTPEHRAADGRQVLFAIGNITVTGTAVAEAEWLRVRDATEALVGVVSEGDPNAS